jgi:NAD-dependent DNA ligase
LGSIGFTGISDKTWELILPKITYQELRKMFNLLDPDKVYYQRAVDFMSSIKGIGPNTADTIAREFKFFQDDIDYIIENGNVIQYKPPVGKKVKLTGTRDRDLINYLTMKGFIVDPNGAVTKDTDILVVPMEGYISEKTKKAQSYGVVIVSMDEIINNTDKYL